MPKKTPNPIPDTLITHHNITQKLKHWATDLNINYHTLYARYQRGDRGEHLLRTKQQVTPNPHTIYLTFNRKTRSIFEWSRIYRTSILGVMQRYDAGERDFYKLFNLTW